MFFEEKNVENNDCFIIMNYVRNLKIDFVENCELKLNSEWTQVNWAPLLVG